MSGRSGESNRVFGQRLPFNKTGGKAKSTLRHETPPSSRPATFSSSSSSTSLSSSSFTNRHQEALDLELSLFQAMLHRNRASHGRTKYGQRWDMAARALRRYRLSSSSQPNTVGPETTVARKGEQDDAKQQNKGVRSTTTATPNEESTCCHYYLLLQLKDEIRSHEATSKQSGKRKRIFASFLNSVSDEIHEEPPDGSTTLLQKTRLEEWQTQFRTLKQCLLHQIPECVDRLDHLAKAFLPEIARGFFMPLCTAAWSSAARIRALLLLFVRWAVTEIPRIGSALTSLEGAMGNQPQQLLWTQDDYRIVMDFLTDKDSSSEESRAATGASSSAMLSTEVQVKASLKSLGWTLSATMINTAFQAERGGSKMAESDEPSHDRPSDRPGAPPEEEVHPRHHDDDLGEAVSARAFWLDHHVEERKEMHTAPPEALGGKPHRKYHELDRNHRLLLEMTATPAHPSPVARSPRLPQRPSPEATTAPIQKRATTMSVAGPKKKKKKPKRDFFDELFG